jgi:hypothetical protein
VSHRNMKYLIDKRIIYARNPVQDEPTAVYDWGMYYEDGTYECYELFKSKAKINTYKSLKWHALVLWYLNPHLTKDQLTNIVAYIADKKNNFVTFSIPLAALHSIIDEVYMMDLEEPPKNKLRKVIFKYGCGLTTSQKLSIVGSLMGRSKKVSESDIYEAMIAIHDANNKITVVKIAQLLKVSTRTVYRSMTYDLNREKDLLNNEKI